ncbi:MAG: GNAT family N-acetyltransferase [Alphaproteobacteria bacterium]|nr:GNAT family N-acetyltransferase [Alphaproteobacteria bacterium]MBV9373770.1 GNAT family N-acetyltransferase [Alphaproteobacteria bacterium]
MEQKRKSFVTLDRWPDGALETEWRACLEASDFATHYTAPEYFLEPPPPRGRRFAVLGFTDGQVSAILTGIRDGQYIQSGLTVRPQIAFSRHANRDRAMTNLLAGLLAGAPSAKLVDLFVWSEMADLVAPRFRQKQYDGVVLLDLSRGPDSLFRKFSENKRTNIKKAIKYGVSVAPAKGADEISAYYRICVEWSLRKNLPIQTEALFQQNFDLKRNRMLFLARHESTIIAGVVIRFFPGGVMEYAANSSLQSALRLRPNDLLHWRAIEWGCREGLKKYSLGGSHLFLRKFGGQIVPTTRCRLDLSMFRHYAIRDWFAGQAERVRPVLPDRLVAAARLLRW